MPIVAAPNLIEQSDFSKGWMPDAEPAHVPANALQNTLNLLPVEPTKSLRTRYGFARVLNGVFEQGYDIKHIFSYPSKDGGATFRRLILILANEQDVDDNIMIYEYDLRSGTANRIDEAERNWYEGGLHPFYGVVIDGIFYGGTRWEPMFSWDGETWNDDCGVFDAKAFSASLKIANTDSSDYEDYSPKDYAFKTDDYVYYGGKLFKFIKNPDHRYTDWDGDKTYQVGNMVTRKTTWAGGASYPVSFRCVKRHKSDDTGETDNAPGTGDRWKQYWRKVFTPAPLDGDGEVRTNFWAWVPAPRSTGHGVFHGQRLWLRADNNDNFSTLQYSGILKYEDSPEPLSYDVALDFNPATAFATGDSVEGGSGGMQPFGAGDGDAINALVSFNNYLLVFKRFSTWVLSGFDESTWTVRKLADVGAVGPDAACEHEGLVYFVGDKGVYVTDGNSIQMAQGLENINVWMREKLGWSNNRFGFTLWSYDGFLWMAFPMYGGRRNTHAIAYYAPDSSWWLTTMNAAAARVVGNDGSTRLYFALPTGLSAATAEWDGEPQESTSTATGDAGTFVNLLKNPGFEKLADDGEMPKFWDKDSVGLDARRRVADAAYEGNAMLRVVNTTDDYRGCSQMLADSDTGTHHISAFARHKNAQGELRNVTYENFRFRVGTGVLAEEAHTFERVGDGWFKVSATYAGSETERKHGFKVKNNSHIFQIDKTMVVAVESPEAPAPPSFDGDGADNGDDEYERFGTHAVLFEYDPEDMDEENPTDDFNGVVEQTKPIVWGVKTAWFPFGTANQQRRVRRIWNMLRGNGTVSVRGYRDYKATQAFEQRFELGEDYTSYYVEGVVMPDSSAVCIEVEGSGAPGVFAGTAIDTEPRRYRYHKNNQSSVGEIAPAIITESGDYLVP